MKDDEFLPFYDRIARRFPGNILGNVVVSGLLGFAFLAAHYASTGTQILGQGDFHDWSWFLGILITTAMLCLYYATHTLRAICLEMDTRLRSEGNKVCLPVIRHVLSDSKFAAAGFLFGLLNCGFGYCFGLPYSRGPAVATILGGYFLAGFVCGMAVWGIYGVVVSIRAFAPKAKAFFDFTSPDGCGGTQFLGDALSVFSSMTLIGGVMISVYVLKTHWTRPNTWWVMSLKGLWIVFPYISSLMVLIGPAVPINKELSAYKIDEERKFKNRLAEIRKALENQPAAAERKELREDYEFRQHTRKELHAMRTWPFSWGANLKYACVLGANAVFHKYVGG